MSAVKKVLLSIILILSFSISYSQQVPLNPISHRVFTPFILNPAIAGSKDFFSIDLAAGVSGEDKSQMLSGNTRLSKTKQNYFSAPGVTEFSNIGVGGYLFNDNNGLSQNTGFGAAGSYHLILDNEALSYVSFGIATKAVFNKYAGAPELNELEKNDFFADFDAGVYYYNKNLYAGLSVVNLIGTPSDADTLDTYTIPASRQLFFQIGYKLVISKSLNILLEPALLINYDDSLSKEIADMLEPSLKLYAGNFCVGTYFNDFNKISVFFQYKYPRFYISTYFELPNNSPYYKTPLRAELALGLNISSLKSGNSRQNHW